VISAPAPAVSGEAWEFEEGPIFLNSNENPYGPSPLARKALAENYSRSNRYNWDTSGQLIASIAVINKLKDENILLGAGSTEILDLVSKYAANGPGSYVMGFPSYTYWSVVPDQLGLKKIKVPLTAAKKLNLEAMQAAITTDTRLVYICNPNNPTGTMVEREPLVSFVNKVPATITILVDEAYLDFTQQPSLSSLIHEHPNMVIAKTFSKMYGLAGARIGYALAHKSTIEKISKLQSSPNEGVSVLSRLAAMASLKDQQFVTDYTALNAAARQYTINELEKLDFKCIPSHTNFIYFSLANYGKDYFQMLKDHRIEGTGIYEETGKWTRITVGTMEEMKQFIKALQ
jgi:histidinol-phosphate aminotransferase